MNIDLTIPDFLDRLQGATQMKATKRDWSLVAAVIVVWLLGCGLAFAHPDSGHHCHVNSTARCH